MKLFSGKVLFPKWHLLRTELLKFYWHPDHRFADPAPSEQRIIPCLYVHVRRNLEIHVSIDENAGGLKILLVVFFLPPWLVHMTCKCSNFKAKL